MMELHEDSDEVYLTVDGLVHFHYYRKFYRGMQAYNNGTYTIDILLKDQTLRLEYDTRERWQEVLQLLRHRL